MAEKRHSGESFSSQTHWLKKLSKKGGCIPFAEWEEGAKKEKKGYAFVEDMK